MQARSLNALESAALLLGCSAALHAQCQPVWSGLNGGATWEVRGLATFDEDGPGPRRPDLFPGGGFGTFAGVEVLFVGRWNGWEVSQVGDGLGFDNDSDGLHNLLAVQETQGLIPAGLYAAGAFHDAGGMPVNSIARWNGHEWYDVGGGLTSPLAVYGFTTCLLDKDGDGPLPPSLFVGGQFKFAGGVPAEGLARWDGEQWSEVGGGLSNGNPDTQVNVFSLAVFDDGRGPALYVGGGFYYAGGQLAYNIARWDGQNWEPVGGLNGGLNSAVESLCVFDEDGDGPKKPALFAGGQFYRVMGDPPADLRCIGRWDGQVWADVGGWLSAGSIRAMTVWDEDGPGPAKESLYVGGSLNILPDLTEVSGIARWDGQEWWPLDYGVDGFGQGTSANALAVFDEDGDGPNPGGLYAGGLFYYAGDVETHHIARWGCPLGPRCEADLDHNGALDLFDFLTFFNLFNNADPAADCDASGSLDLFDFLCFVNAFNAGC